MQSLGDWPLSLERGVRTLNRGARLYGKNGSWRAWVRGTAYILRRLGGRALPLAVVLATTYRCQCHCSHCYAAANERENVDGMSTAETRVLIDELRAVGAIHLNITGGEPLLREDILDLVAHAHASGLIPPIPTNGYLLPRERVASLRRAG